MRGMTKEQILICMGPPKQRAKVNETEVWSYASTNGGGSSYSLSPSTFGYGEHYKSNCTVNVVMKNDQVITVHYNGPSGGWFDSDEQCYYAVQHCVDDE